MKRAAAARGHRDGSGLPWWAFVIAERCHAGQHMSEVARLPRHLSAALRQALSWQTSEGARRSIAALGCILSWMGWRNPKRLNRSTNIGGIPQELWRAITRRQNGRMYSLSSVGHRTHTTGAVGSAEDRTAGFLETLRQAGLLKSWVPPALGLADWMVSSKGYAFAIYRVASSPPPEQPS